MIRNKIAPAYSVDFLETDRPQPLTDNYIESLIEELLPHKWGYNKSDLLYEEFKKEMLSFLKSSKLNDIKGLDSFSRVDIINGCTQFIDNIYMQGKPQYIQGDYRYHMRLGNTYSDIQNLKAKIPLIIAMPFPNLGDVHPEMNNILNDCINKNIDVHIDAAWLSCCRDITFDFSHPAIKSVGFSLSKGLGLGWNRIGIRISRSHSVDSITIMNDFQMNLRAPAMIGLHFLKILGADYLWNKHGSNYYKICNDFHLTPTKSIYLVTKENMPRGLSPLLRYLENEQK